MGLHFAKVVFCCYMGRKNVLSNAMECQETAVSYVFVLWVCKVQCSVHLCSLIFGSSLALVQCCVLLLHGYDNMEINFKGRHSSW